MPAEVIVFPIMLTKGVFPVLDSVVVNTTSKAADSWERDLSPFHLGPCPLYKDFVAERMENAWQFSKVYPEHVKERGFGRLKSRDNLTITQEYWDWALKGWADRKAHRYPAGRGRKPLFSLWGDERLGYIDARKKIYAPLYIESVRKTEGWRRLRELYRNKKRLILLDYDAYTHAKMGMTLTDVLNNPLKKMGHAFVLAMMLTKDPALKQIHVR